MRANDFFNSPYMGELRQRMLDNNPPQECTDCLRHESLGTFSPRDDGWAVHNNVLGHNDRFESTLANPKLEFIELNFSNICNLKCRMCANDRSSKWASDAEAMGFEVHGRVVNDLHVSDEMLSTLKFIRILGGEPLLHEDQMIDILRRARNMGRLGEMSIGITTNGMVMPGDELIDLFSQCRNIWWTVSIDAYGDLNDYIRSGSRWDTIVGHLDAMTKLNTSADGRGYWGVNIGTVCMMLNVNRIRELTDFIDHRYPGLAENHYWYPLTMPEYLSVDRLPEGYLRWLADEYDSMTGSHPSRTDRWWKPLAAHLRQAASDRTPRRRSGIYAAYSGPSLELNDRLDALRGDSLAAVNPEIRQQLVVARDLLAQQPG